MTPGIKRLLTILGIVLVAAAAVGAVALPAAYRARRARLVAEMGRSAQERLAAGETEEATKLYALYLSQSPDDADAYATYATLLRDQTRLPGAGGRQLEAAFDAISIAVRKNPDSLPMRRALAETLLELRQWGGAQEEIGILRERAAAASAESLAAAGIDLDEIALLEARAFFGNGNISDAAVLAAGLAGCEPAGKALDAGWKPGRFVTEASLLLAAILADKRQDPQAAQRVLERLRETAPQDHRAWLAQARWHASRGEAERAAEEIARASALAPDDADVLATSFAMALAGRRFDEAAVQAARMRDLFPHLPNGVLGLAEVAIRRGDPEQSLEPLREGLERMPGHPALLLSLANVQLLTNRLPDAEETIRGLVERGGRTNPAIEMLEARLLVARQQWLAAVRKLDALRPLAAESPDLKRQVDLLLAECHARLGQVDQQLAASQRVLSENAGDWRARVTAAAALAAAGKPEKALAAYEAVAAELGPERLLQQPQVWEPLMRLRAMHQRRLPRKERDWSQVTQLLDALERGQTLPPARLAVLRYDHLMVAGDPAAAAALLTQAIEADAADPQLWERLVIATLQQKGLAAALQAWKRIPAAIVDDERLLVLRARLASRAPEDEAKGILEDLASKAASLPADQGRRVLSAIATSRLGRGDQAGAERVWQAILADHPDDLQTHFALFELACEQRDLAKATRAADEIGRLCGTDSANGRTAAAAKIILEVAVNRSPPAAAGNGRPTQAGNLGAEAMARLDAARNLLVEAENERPGWPVIQRLFADLELLRGDVPAAIVRLEKAVELSPENLPLIRSLVTLLSGSNRQPQARAVLRQILTATGDSVAAEDVRRWASRALAELAREATYRDVEEAVAALAQNQDREGKQAVEDMALSVGLLAGRPEADAWRQAIALLAALADRRPLTTAERLQRADLLERIGRWEDCRRDLLALVAEPETPTPVLAGVVEKLIRHDDLELAASHLGTLAAREPSGIGVIVLETRLAVARDDRPAAAAAVRRLAAAGPAAEKDPRQLQLAAALMEEIGLDDEADAVLVQLADRGAAGIVARAGFLARHGRTAEALDLLQANRQRLGVASFLQAAVSVLRMADVAEAAEQAGRVDEWFAAARQTDRDGTALPLLQADLHAARGQSKEAAAIYRKVLAGGNLSPSQRAIVQNNLAMQLARPETAAEAKELIDEAIAEQGPHPSLLDTQGLVLLAGGAPGEAVKVMREAVLDRTPEKYLHLACALVAGRELEQARQILLESRKMGLDPRRLDADDRTRLETVEAALGIAGLKS